MIHYAFLCKMKPSHQTSNWTKIDFCKLHESYGASINREPSLITQHTRIGTKTPL
jgi:hypothetical protein